MRTTRMVGAGLSLTLLTATLWSQPALAADPAPPLSTVRSAPESTTVGSLTAKAARAAAEDDDFVGALSMPSSYPEQPRLKIYPDANPDAADSGNLTGYDDIAPRLQAVMRSSDRVSTQIVGESTQGRQLYLVTVTAPETEEQTAQQTAWRKELRTDPESAQDTALQAGYKTPVWISANIHGNEWEGTDAALDYIEELADAPWNDVKSLLRGHRLYFSVVLNPDGRTIGQRATALNLDPNRDMITNTTPESMSFVRTAHALQALYAADFHGYTRVLQIEPCGPPHGDDYEYDLFIPHGYAAALRVEQDVVAAQIPGNTYYNVATGQVSTDSSTEDTSHIKIPYRDTPTGWDDYPPIFTAQYAAFTGAVTSTVELPLSRPSGSTQSPANAVVNTKVALQTMKSLVAYVEENSDAMLANQAEFFRRANVGAQKTSLTTENIDAVPGPDQWKPLWNVSDDQNPTTYPRGFAISVGSDQRSLSDARTLVKRLREHNIAVRRLDAAAELGGKQYPAGSYVVDMTQPNRNLAHALLAPGADISNKPGILSMYDVSAWSWGYLWGADVAPFGSTGVGSIPESTRVTDGNADGDVPAAGSYLTFDLAGVNDYRALNALLEEDVKVSQLADGSAIVGSDRPTHDAVANAAEEFDVDFATATPAEIAELSGDAKGLQDLTVGYVGNQDDLLSLTQLGFDDLRAITPTTIATTAGALDGIDVLWWGTGSFGQSTQAAGAAALAAFGDAGGRLVGRGASAFNAAKLAGLIDGTAVAGNNSGNGIVTMDTPSGSVLAPYAQDYSFVYPATWFTGLAESVEVEQTYAAGNPLVSGHWRDTNGSNGPASAAGQPSAVSNVDPSGGKAFVFGSSVFFRTHVKGGMSQAARALFWASDAGDGVAAPAVTTTSLTVTPASVTYPKPVSAKVEVTATDTTAGTPSGTVEIRDGAKVVATKALAADGTATVAVTGLKPGAHPLKAVYVPAEGTRFVTSTSAAASVKVAKATSTTKVKAKALGKKRVAVTVTVKSAAGTPTGTVRIKVGGKSKVVTLRGGKASATFSVAKGPRKVSATYGGSALLGSSAASTTVRVR